MSLPIAESGCPLKQKLLGRGYGCNELVNRWGEKRHLLNWNIVRSSIFKIFVLLFWGIYLIFPVLDAILTAFLKTVTCCVFTAGLGNGVRWPAPAGPTEFRSCPLSPRSQAGTRLLPVSCLLASLVPSLPSLPSP